MNIQINVPSVDFSPIISGLESIETVLNQIHKSDPFKKLKSSIQGFASVVREGNISNILKEIPKFGFSALLSLAKIIDAILKLKKAKDAWKLIWKGLKKTKIIWTVLMATIKGIKAAWKVLIWTILNPKLAWKKMTKFLQAAKIALNIALLTSKTPLLISAKLISVLESIKMSWLSIITALKKAKLTKAAVKAFLLSPKFLIIAVIGLVIGAIKALAQHFQWAANIVEAVGNGFRRIFRGIGRSAQETKESVSDSFDDLGSNTTASMKQTERSIGQICFSMGKNVADTFNKMSLDCSNEMSGMMSFLQSSSSSGTDGIMSNFNTMSFDLQDSMDGISSFCKESFGGLNKDLTDIASNLNSGVSEEFLNLGNRVERSTGDSMNQSTREVQKSVNQMNQAMRPLATSFNQIGQQAMQGLNAGLLAGKNQVLATARMIANQIRSTLQKALRINSPSRVMRDQIGGPIVEGLALGISTNAKQVEKEMESLADKMTGTFDLNNKLGVDSLSTSDISGIPDMIQNTQPIQLVLDGQVLGEVSAPYVQGTINRNSQRHKYFGGASWA